MAVSAIGMRAPCSSRNVTSDELLWQTSSSTIQPVALTKRYEGVDAVGKLLHVTAHQLPHADVGDRGVADESTGAASRYCRSCDEYEDSPAWSGF
jgi:hypothetical protein